EVIIQAMEFYKEVKENHLSAMPVIENRPQKRNVTPNVPHLLLHALSRYAGWLRNENVPFHRKIEKSPEYIEDIERKLKLFVLSLKGVGRDGIRVDEIDDNDIGHFTELLKVERKFSNETVYKHFSYCNSFIKWFSNQYYPVKNYFEGMSKKPISGKNPPSITK